MKNMFCTAGVLLLFASCAKETAEAPSFDVSVSKATYRVNENVIFTFTGNPDYITFYSGEQGAKYANNKRYTASGIPRLQFSTLRAGGTQANSLALMVSSDFTGVGADSSATVRNISAAAWTDITGRAALSTGATTSSGAVDLSDFLASGKPVSVAFKYTGASGTIQNKWTITALTVTNTLADATVYTIANLNLVTAPAITNYGVATVMNPGWAGYKVRNNFNWVVSGSSLVITGASTVPTSTDPSEAWVFATGVVLNKVAPDIGVGIKETSNRLPDPPEYTYVFKSPGTYTVTFVAANGNIDGKKEVIKQVEVTVIP